MRLDKFLKNSRLIKRRTVANEACSQGRVQINGKIAKPSASIEKNDILEIQFGEKQLKLKVLNIADHVKKDEAASLYEIIE